MKRQLPAPERVRLPTSARSGPATPPRLTWRGPVLFYDQRCVACRRFIAWAIGADRTGSLRIAPLHGARFEKVRRGHPEFDARSSAIWFPQHGPPQSQSDAILSVLSFLGGGWRMLARAGRLVPRVLRDKAYRAFATHRRNFGWLGLQTVDHQDGTRAIPGDGPRRVE